MRRNNLGITPNQQKKWGLWETLCVFAPIIIAAVIAVIMWIGTGNIPLPGLKWNDEAAYFELVKTYLVKGWPRGYWGFNGNHAILGTGSAWSPAILLPYFFTGYLFSWNYYSVFLTNLFVLTIANSLFLQLTVPYRKQCMYLTVLQATSTVLILYLTTNMSEPFRFAIAIVLAGMLYRLFFEKNGKIFSYIVVPVFLLYAIQVYTFFSFCIPIYVFAVMKDSKLWKRLAASVPAMIVGAGGSYYLLHLISSNYNIYKTEALLAALKSADIIGAIKAFIAMFKEGAYGILGILQSYSGNLLLLWYLPFCGLIVILACILLIVNLKGKKTSTDNGEEQQKKKQDITISIITIYSVVIFYFMYMTVYSIEYFTLLRGTYIVMVFVIYFLVLANKKWIPWCLIALQAIGLIALPYNLSYFCENRYLTKEERTENERLSSDFFSAFTLENTGNPWDNTVAIYTLEPRVISAIPAGMGVNMILNPGSFPTEAAYLLFSLEKDEKALNPEWLETYYPSILAEHRELLETEYEVVYLSEDYIIYHRRIK